jgi:hypothetical protein
VDGMIVSKEEEYTDISLKLHFRYAKKAYGKMEVKIHAYLTYSLYSD